MLEDHTKSQIAQVKVHAHRPLIICDVDEVVVHFIKGLEAYLSDNGMWLDPASFALNGNIKQAGTQTAITPAQLNHHLMVFFAERTIALEPIEGAAEALHALARHAQVIMLTNLPGAYRSDRISNLLSHGIDFPVIANSGPKGPAVAALADRHKAPLSFIDDNPGYLGSVGEHCPRADLIHFMQDDRFGRHVGPLDFVSLRADNWRDTCSHIQTSWQAE